MRMISSAAFRQGAAARVLVIAALLPFQACRSAHGEFVWVNDYPQQATAVSSEHLLGTGDLVQVQVYDNEKLSTRGRVLDNGNIGIPLVGEVPAAERTTKRLALDIEQAFRDQKLVLNPRVTVLLEEVQPLKISVLGAVAHPGTFPMEAGSGVAEALASAGGLTEFAHRDRIYVLRRMPAPARIRFTFNALTEVGSAASFRLHAGDVVVAE